MLYEGRMYRIFSEPLFEGSSLYCEILSMGEDYHLAVYGGDKPHIGSVTMSVARPSLTGEGTGVTSSILNKSGHKDEEIGRLFSETVAKYKNCTAVCSCGIHIDHITKDQIGLVREAGRRLLDKVLEALS